MNSEQQQSTLKSTEQDSKVNVTSNNTGNELNESEVQEPTSEQENSNSSNVAEYSSEVINNEEVTNDQGKLHMTVNRLKSIQ